MNIIGHGVCVFICFVGGGYALWILRDVCRQIRTRENDAANVGANVLRSVQIGRLCELLFAGAFLIVAGVVLTATVQQDLPLVAARLSSERQYSVQIPGMQALSPRRLRYENDRPRGPIVGADLAGLPIADADIRALACHAPQLTWLILSGTTITDESLSDIGQMPRLAALNLAHTQISDSGLQHLAELRGLEFLSLDDTHITDDGLKYLGKLNRLQDLSLENTAITDAGLQWLRRLHGLKLLVVDGTQITRRGVELLHGRGEKITSP